MPPTSRCEPGRRADLGHPGALRVVFDRGTLVLAGVACAAPTDSGRAMGARVNDDVHVDVGGLPGVLWDARTGSFRARASDHAAIVDELRRSGVPFVDETGPFAGPTGPWAGEVTLRPYQEDALAAWELGGRRGVVVLPTGAGKTRLAIAALSSTRLPALVLAPTRVLLDQWASALRAAGLAGVGLLGDGERRIEPVTVATFESAWRQAEQIGSRFRLLVVDEAHHFAAGARTEILESCTAASRLGLTATPVEDAGLDALIGPTVYSLGVRDLQGTFLADFDLVRIGVQLTRDERERYDELRRPFVELARTIRRTLPAATFADLAATMARSLEGREAMEGLRRAKALTSYPERKRVALARVLERERGRRTLVFTVDNEAAYAVAREHLVAPLTCDIGRKEREQVLARFKSGEVTRIVSARVLNEGVDVPDAEVAVVLGGRASEREHVQRIGRVLRPSLLPDGSAKKAVVYEIVARGTMEERASERRHAAIAGPPARAGRRP